eukprot:gene25513-11255_t
MNSEASAEHFADSEILCNYEYPPRSLSGPCEVPMRFL